MGTAGERVRWTFAIQVQVKIPPGGSRDRLRPEGPLGLSPEVLPG